MSDCRITCIRKHNHASSHEHITHVGNRLTASIRTANQFMLAVAIPDEHGISKLTDNFLALAFG